MKPTFNNDSLSAIDLAQKSLALGSSPSEVIELIQSVTELSNVQNQHIQAKQDEERRGYLMQDIMRLIAQLKIPTSQQRVLKAMTTSQLDAYAEELHQQSKERPIKHLSVA
jgi:phage terminase Nu1 subunit (DNA packaging protein)